MNSNILKFKNLVTPIKLYNILPTNNKLKQFVLNKRNEINNILNGLDDRKIIIAGPCSIHNVNEAKEYGMRLKQISDKVKDKILIIMRVYFEKPRTTIGWKGLINDPDLDNSCNINKGLFLARELLTYLNSIEIPCAYEVLDTFTPQYISDLISWGAIGARTTESQVHRQLVSGCSFPIGFKNSRSGDINVAIEAIISANNPSCFYGITNEGDSAIVHTKGNKNCHIILRGGNNKTNYDLNSVNLSKKNLNSLNLRENVMIDCSHGNSFKNYNNQSKVFEYICNEIEKNRKYIFGLMLESNLVEGKQKLIFGEKNELEYGKSITDCCIDIKTTDDLVNKLYNIL